MPPARTALLSAWASGLEAWSIVLRIRVLGFSPVRPNPGCACSGFLLESSAGQFLIDCGTGVLGELLLHTDLRSLAGVFISHAHPDHCLDLINIRQALAHAMPVPRETPLPVYTSTESLRALLRIGACFGEPQELSKNDKRSDPAANLEQSSQPDGFWTPWIEFTTLGDYDHLQVGSMSVRTFPTKHYLHTLALRFSDLESPAGADFVYGADTGPCEGLDEFAREAGLLILESTMLRRDQDLNAWGHLSADEAGRIAKKSGVSALLLTHYFSENTAEATQAAAQVECDIPVKAARTGMVLDV